MKRLDRCIKIICDINGTTPMLFHSRLKNEEAARARHIAQWYFSENKFMSLTRIGNVFGNVAHCSVIYGRKKIFNSFDTNDKKVLYFVNECKKQLDDFLPDYVTPNYFDEELRFCDTSSIEITTTNILEL